MHKLGAKNSVDLMRIVMKNAPSEVTHVREPPAVRVASIVPA